MWINKTTYCICMSTSSRQSFGLRTLTGPALTTSLTNKLAASTDFFFIPPLCSQIWQTWFNLHCDHCLPFDLILYSHEDMNRTLLTMYSVAVSLAWLIDRIMPLDAAGSITQPTRGLHASLCACSRLFAGGTAFSGSHSEIRAFVSTVYKRNACFLLSSPLYNTCSQDASCCCCSERTSKQQRSTCFILEKKQSGRFCICMNRQNASGMSL